MAVTTIGRPTRAGSEVGTIYVKDLSTPAVTWSNMATEGISVEDVESPAQATPKGS